MADLKQVIKSMLDKGMTREEVLENLQELGFTDAESVFDKSFPGYSAKAKKEPEEIELPEEESPGESKSLFGRGAKKEEPEEEESDGDNDLFAGVDEEEPAPAKKEETRKKPAVEMEEALPPDEEMPGGEDEKPPSIISIGSDGDEKEVSLTGEEPAAAKGKPFMHSVSGTRFQDLDSVEAKLDETIALLKALREINKRIIETDRKILLRLEK